MARIKLYAAAGIFIVTTAIKFISPAMASDIRQRIIPAISENEDYRQIFHDLGEKLSKPEEYISVLYQKVTDIDKNEQSDAVEASAQGKVYEPVYLAHLIEKAQAILPEKSSELTETELPESDIVSAEENIAEQENPAVAAFMAELEAFSGHSLPENVDVSMPALPFSYASPIPGYKSSGFGFRVHPLQNTVKFHYGTDIAANSGDDIYAFASGSVRAIGENEGYGLYVIIDHPEGYSTLYAHCSKIYVYGGQYVELGEKIALVGATGQVTGPHLHFELMLDQDYLNPDYYINQI